MNTTLNYPKIVLSENNPEIQDCLLFNAFVGLFADFLLKDGTRFDFADVIDYTDGVFVISVGNHDHYDNGFTVIVPIQTIDTITYI